jgi:ABC-type uncharacterized transport system substrate-binding protein
MRLFGHSLRACLVSILAAGTLMAGDYDDVLTTVKATWPERRTVGILCSLDGNQMALLDLTDAAKAKDFNVVVVNLTKPRELAKQMNALLSRHPDVILVMDDDPLVGVKTVNIRTMINQALTHGVPSVSITEAALKCGAVLAVGNDTQGRILVNMAVAKKLKLELPAGAVPSK